MTFISTLFHYLQFDLLIFTYNFQWGQNKSSKTCFNSHVRLKMGCEHFLAGQWLISSFWASKTYFLRPVCFDNYNSFISWFTSMNYKRQKRFLNKICLKICSSRNSGKGQKCSMSVKFKWISQIILTKINNVPIIIYSWCIFTILP